MSARRRYKVAEVEAALRANAGLQTEAARALGCERRTIARYIERHPRLAKVRADVEERMKDVSESRLFRLLSEGDPATLRWYLARKARDRGYGDKIEHSGDVGGGVSHVTITLVKPDQTTETHTREGAIPSRAREAEEEE